MKWILSTFALAGFVLILSGCGNQETNHGLPIPPPPTETTTAPVTNSDSANQNRPLSDTSLPDTTANH